MGELLESKSMFQNVQPSDHRIPQGSSGVTQAAAHTAVTRVVLADPAPVVLAGLRTFLCEAQGFEVVGETTTSDDLLELLARVKPYIVAVDAIGQEGFPSSPVWFQREWRAYYEPFVGAWHQ